MPFKPVGADENGRFPPRVEARLAADFGGGSIGGGTGGSTSNITLEDDPADPGMYVPVPVIDGGGGGGVTDPEVVRDVVGSALVAGTGISINVNDTGDTITITNTSPGTTTGGITDQEVVRDTIGAALRAGENMTIVVDDAANTITLSSTGGGTTGVTDPEVVRDTIANALRGGAGIAISPNDTGDTITISSTVDPAEGAGVISARNLSGQTIAAGGAWVPITGWTSDTLVSATYASTGRWTPRQGRWRVSATVVVNSTTSHVSARLMAAGTRSLDTMVSNTIINGATWVKLTGSDYFSGTETLEVQVIQVGAEARTLSTGGFSNANWTHLDAEFVGA
jgi:hypothetical protein